ncbi:hypothetical protein EV421DRAFT_1466491 [Armillaria borealis]|uniref:Uncharacterized protein n=1 Tax=Armillaria borealis TaxID=47425 RepID=A0AA39MWM3_9AGAR|nr:hypothetical protein EV421DRAFT_1466491 [Armillaria borealis]
MPSRVLFPILFPKFCSWDTVDSRPSVKYCDSRHNHSGIRQGRGPGTFLFLYRMRRLLGGTSSTGLPVLTGASFNLISFFHARNIQILYLVTYGIGKRGRPTFSPLFLAHTISLPESPFIAPFPSLPQNVMLTHSTHDPLRIAQTTFMTSAMNSCPPRRWRRSCYGRKDSRRTRPRSYLFGYKIHIEYRNSEGSGGASRALTGAPACDEYRLAREGHHTGTTTLTGSVCGGFEFVLN